MMVVQIRNIDPAVLRCLRERAARHGVSLEEEIVAILSDAVAKDDHGKLVGHFLTTFGRRHGVDLALPDRSEGPRDPFAPRR